MDSRAFYAFLHICVCVCLHTVKVCIHTWPSYTVNAEVCECAQRVYSRLHMEVGMYTYSWGHSVCVSPVDLGVFEFFIRFKRCVCTPQSLNDRQIKAHHVPG